MNSGIRYFLHCCEQVGISIDDFCASEARKDTVFEKAYINQTGNKLQLFHKFVIKYYPQDDLFICWKAHIKNRKNYRLLKKEVLDKLECNQLVAKKGIEFAWRELEDVYVFKTSDIHIFLEFLKLQEE